MTEKLYDKDAYLTEFNAKVVSCVKENELYKIVLDRTLFFPEEGGQCCDKGTLNDIDVEKVEILEDGIIHYLKKPLETGKEVYGKIDFSVRYRNMQNHTGEHILTGTLHNLYGAENTGFHLGSEYITMDINIPLTKEQIDRAELAANEVVFNNKKIFCYYPENPEALTYRSKLDLKENVRIVEIEDTDMCACCAPHLKTTSEVGIIKIYDYMNFRGGTRFIIKCGFDVYGDFKYLKDCAKDISGFLSVKQEEIGISVAKLKENYDNEKQKLAEMTEKYCLLVAETSEKPFAFFDTDNTDAVRIAVNKGVERFGFFAGFITDADKVRYIIGSKTINLRDEIKELNTALSGKGGGKDTMVQGSFSENPQKISEYFEKMEKKYC